MPSFPPSAGGGGGAALPNVTAMVPITVTTAATPTSGLFTAYPAQACTELWIENKTGTEIDYARNATAANAAFMSIRPGQTRRIVGITDASQIAVRRSDYADTNSAYAARTSGVRALAVTSTEAFVVAGISNTAITSGGANTQPGAIACTGVEIVNNMGKDIAYRIGATGQYIQLAVHASTIVLGITNASQIYFQPFDNVTDTTRPVMMECFASGLREPLNQQQPAQIIGPDARLTLSDVQAPSRWPAGTSLSMSEMARGPRRTLTPPKVYPLAQFSTVANMVGSVANSADVTTGEIYMGTSQVEFTQATSGTWTFAPSSTLGTGINTANGSIRIAVCFPSGTPSYQSGGAFNAFKIQLFSSGSAAAPPANYHEYSLYSATASERKSVSTQSVPSSMFTAVGTGADMSAITWARFQLVSNSAANGAKFRPVAIDFVPNTLSKAIVVFSVDDFNAGTFTGLMPILSKYGYPGMIFADSIWALGQSGFMTLEQVRILHQHYGWQIANQNYHSETQSLYGNEAMIKEHAKYMLAMQLIGVSDLEDTTSGYQTQTNIRDDNMPAIKRMFRSNTLFLGGNNTNPPLTIGETAPFGNPYAIKRLNMSSFTGADQPTTLQRYKDHVDQAVANKGVAIFGAHTEFNGVTVQSGATIDLVEYIRGLELAGQVEVLTLSQAIGRIYPRLN